MGKTIKLSHADTHSFWEIPVLFEDEHLLVLDKPAGLEVSPTPEDPEPPSLLKLLHAGIAESKPWAKERNLQYLMSAHRLDAEVTGVLVLAKAKTVMIALADLLGSEKPYQSFIALVKGEPTEDNFAVETKLSAEPTAAGFFRAADRRGKRSKTLFQVVEKFKGWALLNCEPLTSRPHQIRAHLRHAHLPVAGDPLYGGRPLLLSSLKRDYRLKPNRTERPLIGAPALHAEKLNIPHPVTGEPLVVSAPLPRELTVAIKYLRRYAVPATASNSLAH